MVLGFLLPCIISYQLGGDLMPPDQKKMLYTLGTFLILILFSGLVMIVSKNQNKITFGSLNPLVEYFGARSYSYYVLHYPIFALVWLLINQYWPFVFYGNPLKYGLVQAILFLFVSVPLVEVSYRFIELPAILSGKNLLNYLRSGSKSSESAYG